MPFVYSQFKCPIVLFDPEIGPNQVLSLRVRVEQGMMTMKEYSAFSKAPGQESNDQMVLCHIWDHLLQICSLYNLQLR